MEFGKAFKLTITEKYDLNGINACINDPDCVDADKLEKIKKAGKIKKNVLLLDVKLEFKYGERAYPKGGLTLALLKKETRKKASVKCIDIDIVNCQPSILLYLADKHSVKSPILENYVKNRDQILIENNLTKTDITAIINGGNKTNGNTFLKEFKDEIEKINEKFITIEDFKHNIKHAKTSKDIINPKNFLYYIVSEFETKLWVENYKALLERFPIHINEYEYDGYLIQLPENNIVVAPEITEFLNDLTSKFGIKYIQKEFNENFEKIEKVENESSEKPDAVSPLVMLDKLMEIETNHIKNIGNTIFVFDKKTGMWAQDGIGIFMNMCADAFGRETLYGGYPEEIQKIFKMCRTLDDATDWFIKARNNRLGKILYSNGVLNIETGLFEDFNCNYFFTKRISRPFNPKKNEKHYNKVLNTLFYAPLKKEIAIEFLKAIGLAMTGRNPDEASYDNLGTGSNGKTLMMNGLLEAFPGYVDPFPIVAFRVNANAGANAHNDMKVKMSDIRIGLSSEGAAGMVTDSEEFKRMSSQEQFYGRECGEKVVKIKPEMTFFSFSQNPIKFDKIDKAVMRRRFGFPWNKTFAKAEKGTLDFLKETETYEALDHIILYGFKLWNENGFSKIEELITFKEQLDCEQDIFSEIFEENWELAIADKDNKHNWVKGTYIFKSFKGINTSDYTIKNKLLELGIIHKQGKGLEGNTTYFMGIRKKGSKPTFIEADPEFETD